jgi:hypothetical protein
MGAAFSGGSFFTHRAKGKHYEIVIQVTVITSGDMRRR